MLSLLWPALALAPIVVAGIGETASRFVSAPRAATEPHPAATTTIADLAARAHTVGAI